MDLRVLVGVLAVVLSMLQAGCLEAAPAVPDRQGAAVVRSWFNESWDGTVQGPNIVAFSMNPVFLDFTMPQATKEAWLNLSAAGGRIYAYAFNATCESTECAYRFDTADDRRFFHAARPAAGDWEIHVAKGEPGNAPVAFTMELASYA